MPALRNQQMPSRSGRCECMCRRIGNSKERPHFDIISQYMCSRVKAHISTLPHSEISPSVASHCLAFQPAGRMEAINSCPSPKELNFEELELMVQWCTTTHRSIAHSDAAECIWHAVIPREAMHHPFLMHGILALSALHLAFTSSGGMKERYLMTALSHRSQARVGLTKVQDNLNESNTNAVFALFNILIVFAFALPLTMEPLKDQTPLDELCEVFRLTKTWAGTITALIERVGDGEMKQLVEYDDSPPRMPDTSRVAIMALCRMNATLTRQNPKHEHDIYSAAIKHLGDSLDKLARGGEFMIIAFQWILQFPPRFVDLLREREPFALIILAHFAVILHSLRGHWWMGEWAARLISQISQQLGSESKQSIGWVLDATGCYIPPL
ncbi:hypothetical protein BDV23DRAFT_159398 [Aspergillus alliaceus]|uniref:Zn(II)2Cys6 transcription factor n=1 Tax=Petromyces alliaceus TaxID=209559 RepID=A0A5N7C2F6_PETAA|nr:hypothetical protein BDV23DRAFT_159398 [Aspergillus alliaceus]